MKLKIFKQIKNLKNKKVLVRAGFDVPILPPSPDLPLEVGTVIDDCRIRFAMPTIEYLVERGAKVILISHLGRPKGRRVQKYSLKPVYKNLKFSLEEVRPLILKMRGRTSITFVDDCVGEKVEKVIDEMRAGEVVLLENLRFYSGEEKNDPKFAKQLADLADIYINDAFSVSHRKHASVCAITKYLPSYAGFLLEKEVNNLSLVLQKPQHPFVVVMGGVKISTKIGPIKNLVKIADHILVGGALANNFLKVQGINIGKSFYEPKMIETAKELLENKKIILPCDFKTKSGAQLSAEFEILDIGPKTIKLFSQYIKEANMIVWNGPMGYFEDKRFSQGTKAIAQAILKNKKAKIIIGGGETITALAQLTNRPKKGASPSGYSSINQLPDNIFVSSGGGAMLVFLAGKSLPGINPLIQ